MYCVGLSRILLTVLSRGVHMREAMPEGTGRINPLVLAIRANYLEDPDFEYNLPDTVQLCCRHAALQMIMAPQKFHL